MCLELIALFIHCSVVITSLFTQTPHFFFFVLMAVSIYSTSQSAMACERPVWYVCLLCGSNGGMRGCGMIHGDGRIWRYCYMYATESETEQIRCL